MGGAFRTHGIVRNACKILFGKPEGKIILRIQMQKCEDNIRKDVREYCGRLWTGSI
jgi:hypothetical protein